MNSIRTFLQRVKSRGVKRPDCVRTVSMGRTRTFEAYDLGVDTFILETGLCSHLGERPSVLVVSKAALGRHSTGRVMTLSTGNHAVAALPLLDGRFWKISTLPANQRSATLAQAVLCSNVVGETIETSQRDVPAETLFAHDAWLLKKVGFPLDAIVMGDRNAAAIEHYRRLGQEWRMKPLAWTEGEMRQALGASRKRISTSLTYYHSARGVHFLSYGEFRRLTELAERDAGAFLEALRELVGVYEGEETSFARQLKFRGHHEIEFFGVKRGEAIDRIVPELESLLGEIEAGQVGHLGVLSRLEAISVLYASLLSQSELADENSLAFVETLYMYITGEVYSVVGEGSIPAFDDRRTALPGATFTEGQPSFHPGADTRSEEFVANLMHMMSRDEEIEYVNIYELRNDDDVPIGLGSTREIVYKTNRRPLESSLIEKRLSSRRHGYSDYMLARIGALRALGVGLSTYYRLLTGAPGRRSMADYYIRRRCEGEPMEAIPANYYRQSDACGAEDAEIVKRLASLMGDAAAQNMAMKKYDPKSLTPLFGVGKEIYEFAYDILSQRVLPAHVTTCSIRGSFGWPELEPSEENLAALADFYLGHYARAFVAFQRRHGVGRDELALCFWEGFAHRLTALAWQLSVMRDRFETFLPEIPRRYAFARRWQFVMWSLAAQANRLDDLKGIFFQKVSEIEA